MIKATSIQLQAWVIPWHRNHGWVRVELIHCMETWVLLALNTVLLQTQVLLYSDVYLSILLMHTYMPLHVFRKPQISRTQPRVQLHISRQTSPRSIFQVIILAARFYGESFKYVQQALQRKCHLSYRWWWCATSRGFPSWTFGNTILNFDEIRSNVHKRILDISIEFNYHKSTYLPRESWFS